MRKEAVCVSGQRQPVEGRANVGDEVTGCGTLSVPYT